MIIITQIKNSPISGVIGQKQPDRKALTTGTIDNTFKVQHSMTGW
jgi:hypothetical protein